MAEAPTEPRDAPDASVDDELIAGRAAADPISDSPAGLMLKDSLGAMYRIGDDAEEFYQETLDRLREIPDKVLVEISRALGSCSGDDYALRWALIHTATQLDNELALPLLVSIVETPIPEERSSDTHSYSTVAEETLLRTTATEGVGRLAERGSRQAVGSLLDFLEIDSVSIRRAAVQSLMVSPEYDDLRTRIEEHLPKSQHFLLELKPTNVREVEQIPEPQSHLSEVGRVDSKSEPPRFDADQPDDNGEARQSADREASPRQSKKAD